MARPDFTSHRLFIDAPLAAGVAAALDGPQANYLFNVLRLQPGAELLAFNGRDGEWRVRLARPAKREASLTPLEQLRPQPLPNDLHCLFAPLKHARLDYMVQKAVEMGVSRLQPALTARTQATRVNIERMRANAIEAAEQCGVLVLPDVGEAQPLAALLAAMETDRALVFCDEDAAQADPVSALRDLGEARKLAVVIGPEGGFDPRERALLLARPRTLRLSLGPRILRADTAAVAALALVQAVLGDWRPMLQK